MSHSFHNTLQDNAESSDTFINKAVFDCCFLYKNCYYKYNRIPVFYHLPFAFMETNSKMALFQHFVCICSINGFFNLYVYILLEICLKLFYNLSFCIALWDIYYVHLVWEDIEIDLNRITDFLINLWDSFQIYFLNFINVLAMVFGQSTLEATDSVDEAKG